VAAKKDTCICVRGTDHPVFRMVCVCVCMIFTLQIFFKSKRVCNGSESMDFVFNFFLFKLIKEPQERERKRDYDESYLYHFNYYNYVQYNL